MQEVVFNKLTNRPFTHGLVVLGVMVCLGSKKNYFFKTSNENLFFIVPQYFQYIIGGLLG